MPRLGEADTVVRDIIALFVELVTSHGEQNEFEFDAPGDCENRGACWIYAAANSWDAKGSNLEHPKMCNPGTIECSRGMKATETDKLFEVVMCEKVV